MEPDLDTLLELERMRLTWDFASKEVDLQRQRLLQVFAAFVTLGLTAFASVIVGHVPFLPGLSFFGIAMAGAFAAQARMARLSSILRASYLTGLRSIERLKLAGGR